MSNAEVEIKFRFDENQSKSVHGSAASILAQDLYIAQLYRQNNTFPGLAEIAEILKNKRRAGRNSEFQLT